MTGNPTSDLLLDYDDSIFVRRELLQVGHVPNADRIVGRDNEIKAISELVQPALHSDSSKNGMIYGHIGTGKSLVSRHVTATAQQLAPDLSQNIATAYIDCDQANTETRAARTLARQINADVENTVKVPEKGIGTDGYYSRIWTLLTQVDACIIIIDEIDKLADAEILFTLSRANESRKTDCKLCTLAISNRLEFGDTLDERIRSSFQARECVFQPYDATQLRHILENRRDAFQEGVLENGVVERTAALAAREHGDARKAIDILLHAGEIAKQHDHNTVTEDHVNAAQSYAEVSRFREVVNGATPHSRYALYALAKLTAYHNSVAYSTGDIYQMYQQVCNQKAADPLSHQRILDLLKEWALLEVTEHQYRGRGRGEGSYREHRLMIDPEIVIETVETDNSDSDIENFEDHQTLLDGFGTP